MENKTVPSNANEQCPGLESTEAGKSSACAGCPNQKQCASGEARAEDPAIAEIAAGSLSAEVPEAQREKILALRDSLASSLSPEAQEEVRVAARAWEPER